MDSNRLPFSNFIFIFVSLKYFVSFRIQDYVLVLLDSLVSRQARGPSLTKYINKLHLEKLIMSNAIARIENLERCERVENMTYVVVRAKETTPFASTLSPVSP
jgi:hypothetical protein